MVNSKGRDGVWDRGKHPDGVLVILEIQHFSKIDEQYGLIFGDIILEQFAGLLAERFQAEGLADGIYIRAGADQMLVWLPKGTVIEVKKAAKKLGKDFAGLTDEKYLSLSLKGGIAVTSQNNSLSQALEHLNLFDREGKTSVVLDILSLKLQEKYRLSNMIITHFSREYMVNDLFYCWQRNHFQGWDGLVHCKEKEYQQFMEEQEMQLLLLPEKDTRWAPLIQPYLSGENDIVFHMTDNGRYSGSIIFQGISSDIQGRKEECKCLREISAIIQNRLNVERQNAAGRRKV